MFRRIFFTPSIFLLFRVLNEKKSVGNNAFPAEKKCSPLEPSFIPPDPWQCIWLVPIFFTLKVTLPEDLDLDYFPRLNGRRRLLLQCDEATAERLGGANDLVSDETHKREGNKDGKENQILEKFITHWNLSRSAASADTSPQTSLTARRAPAGVP